MITEPVTYYQHIRDEPSIVAVFAGADPFVSEFGHAAFPAIYFEPTMQTFIGPRTFSPVGQQYCYRAIARDVAATIYPDHVRWVELITASCQCELVVAAPPEAPQESLWPDLHIASWLIQAAGAQSRAALIVATSAGQSITTALGEADLLRLSLQVRQAIHAVQSERAAYFLVAFGGDYLHLIPRAKRTNKRPRMLCNRLPPEPFKLLPLVEHPLEIGGVCYDCRESWALLTHDHFM